MTSMHPRTTFIPSPPLDQCVHKDTFTPSFLQKSIKAFTSLSVSVIKWFTATATGNPNFLTLFAQTRLYLQRDYHAS